MTKARDLANLIAAGNPLADGTISVAEISDLTASAAELNYNDITTLGTVQPSKVVTADANGDVHFGDSDQLLFGASNDLAILHNGSSSIIRDSGTGNLVIQAEDFGVQSSDGSATHIYVDTSTGYVGLHYGGVVKLNTNSTGIDVTGSVGIGAPNTSVFNGVGGTSRLVAKGSDTATNIANNSDASITIANDDGTANNLAGLHFARADTDDSPHYAGASVVAQFLETQVTGQYPKAELAFLVSQDSNNAPSEKMRINALGADVSGELIADSYNETYSALSGTSPTVNCETGNSFSLTLSGNTTFTFSNPPASGTSYTFSIEIIQDASASGYTVTWPASVDWPAATAPTLTATASAKDIFVFTTRDGGTNWYGFTAGQALA